MGEDQPQAGRRPSPKSAARQARLAKALRANLRRRKASKGDAPSADTGDEMEDGGAGDSLAPSP